MKIVVNVVGKQRVDFVTEDGKHIEGFSIFSLKNVNPKYGEGQTIDKKFISVDSPISYSDVVIGNNSFDIDLSGHLIGLSK